MLQLRRKVGQTIVIGGEIRVTISKSNSSGATLVIDAPKDIPVNREEIQLRVDREERRALKQDR